MFSTAQLLLPVSAEQVCGEDLSFSSEVDEIARARTFDDPTLEQGAWVADIKEADWQFVCRRCADLIATRSKDVRLAVWLAEALARTAGLPGLGDGYAVLAGLCEHYWQGLYPQTEEGDDEQRIGNLFWLLNRTPSLVREMAFDGGLAPLDEVEYCLAMLGELERVTDLRLGAAGPGFGAARDAVQSLLRGRSIGNVGNATTRAAAAPEQAPAMAQGGQGGQGPLQNRTQALLQLRMVADFFRRTEPHSPVAYLADKAADWGDMPLHLWLRAVLRDQAALAAIEESLGSSLMRE